MDESMYDEFGNYLGPDLSDEEEDDEEEYAQQQAQDQDMAEGDEEEDVEMEEENVRTSTALSRLGGNETKPTRKKAITMAQQICTPPMDCTNKLTLDLFKLVPS